MAVTARAAGPRKGGNFRSYPWRRFTLTVPSSSDGTGRGALDVRVVVPPEQEGIGGSLLSVVPRTLCPFLEGRSTYELEALVRGQLYHQEFEFF